MWENEWLGRFGTYALTLEKDDQLAAVMPMAASKRLKVLQNFITVIPYCSMLPNALLYCMFLLLLALGIFNLLHSNNKTVAD